MDNQVIGVSKLFARGRTVVPSEVRKQLKVMDGDRLVWIRSGTGRISVEPSRAPRGRFQPVEETES